MKKAIQTPGAPAAIGPYSQAIQSGKWLFCSGQIGLDPASGQLVEGGIEAQTRRVLQNIDAILRASGLGFEDVLKTTIFLVDLADFETVNRIYREYLGEQPFYPARSTVQVAALPRGARIEIEAIARRRS